MSEQKFEDFVVRIHQLERSNRLWKSIALGGAAFLLFVVGGVGVLHNQALQAARLEAERARVEADQARAAEVRAREVAERMTYANMIQMANQQMEKDSRLKPK
jgi:hypothetical protein